MTPQGPDPIEELRGFLSAFGDALDHGYELDDQCEWYKRLELTLSILDAERAERRKNADVVGECCGDLCRRLLTTETGFRCIDCKMWFCLDDARRHFDTADRGMDLAALRAQLAERTKDRDDLFAQLAESVSRETALQREVQKLAATIFNSERRTDSARLEEAKGLLRRWDGLLMGDAPRCAALRECKSGCPCEDTAAFLAREEGT